MNSVYRERNALVAFLASVYDSVLVESSEDEQGWGIVFVETPAGQMSWHVHPDDFDLFERLEVVERYEWDGHTTEEKYQLLASLGEDLYK